MPFIEVINGTMYEIYQENGTKYYRNFNTVPIELKDNLEQCAGEIFLSNIPEYISAHQIAAVACHLGDMYVLRFKVNFAALSRGFAYLQYMNPYLMDYAIETLPKLFINYGYGNIHVRRSKNSSNLVMRNVTELTAEEVPIVLAELCNYRECNLRYYWGYKLEYQLVFGSNEDAVKARRFLLGQMHLFGSLATICWDKYAN